MSKIYITDLWITGVQSYKDTAHISFSKGFNAIVGPTNSGKSTIMRSLKFVLFNETTTPNLITRGLKECSVRVRISNGREVTRKRIKKENIYELYEPGEEVKTLTGFGSKPVKEVLDFTGMRPITISGDETFISFQGQHEPLFFLGDSPAKKATLIGSLAKTDIIDAAISDTDTDLKRNKVELKRLTGYLELKRRELDDYDNLPVQEDDLKTCNKIYEEINSLDEKADDILLRKNQVVLNSERLNERKKIIAREDDITYASKCIDRLETKSDKNKTVLRSIDSFKGYDAKRIKNQKIIDKIDEKDINYALKIAAYISDKQDIIEKVSGHHDEIKSLNRRLQKYKESIGHESSISDVEVMIADISKKQVEVEKLVKATASATNEFSRFKKGIVIIEAREEELNSLNEKFDDYIKENPVCPICGSDLTTRKENILGTE